MSDWIGLNSGDGYQCLGNFNMKKNKKHYSDGECAETITMINRK